ncbi:hypothetical protein TNCT_70861 [Trichonephila clavata]|uniref:Uncharacterized protein n=1 Tax=Trichonephila clavata TaxID=2740835 RepID=A0A8X6G045_TRICU|nr:hypothetical protein TNCT_70861 [Trichonephila clavata]
MDSQLCLNVFTREMEQHDNPHLTFETLVLRLLKRVSHSFHLPWSHVLEVSRQAPYLMDPISTRICFTFGLSVPNMPRWMSSIASSVFWVDTMCAPRI